MAAPKRSAGTSQDSFLAAAQKLAPQVVKWRRRIHQHPELAYKEVRTADFVAKHLTKLGLEPKVRVGGTGVAALVRGQSLKPTILLRADMDALPIQEEADVPYRSRVSGVMHACGHDVHTAGLMGVASILARMAPKLPGSVKLCFQPAEEGGAGALAMINDGLLEDPLIHAAAALHVHGGVKEGAIGLLDGPVTAFADGLDIIVRGASAHAAAPQEGTDSIVIAAHLITSLQSLIARQIDPLRERCLTLGKINGGTASNVLAESVHISGTVRSFDEKTRRRIFKLVRRHAKSVTAAMGGTAEVIAEDGYPPQINDDGLNEVLERCATGLLGAKNVERLRDPSLGGEDFAYYGRKAKVPSVLFRLGIRPQRAKDIAPGHSSHFRINDQAVLPTGVAVLAKFAVEAMKALA